MSLAEEFPYYTEEVPETGTSLYIVAETPEEDVEPTMLLDRSELLALIQQAQNGQSDAFDQLYRATYQNTYSHAFALAGNEHDAHDITHEAYLRAFRALGRFRGDAQFTTWLYRITENYANTFLRQRKKHTHEPLYEDTPLYSTSTTEDPEAAVETKETQRKLLRVLEKLGRLNPEYKKALVQSEVYGLTHHEVADELGISPNASKIRLHRARQKLHELWFSE